MAQYHFIGGDGKPYGPYTLEQMKEHQAGNRLNAKTQVSVDGGGWQQRLRFDRSVCRSRDVGRGAIP